MRILVVEDEKEIADGIQAILKHEGYESDVVYAGDEALEYMRTGIYDLVLLDVMLPGMDGFEVIRHAKNEGISAPIILLTAKSMVDDKIKGLDLGADDYLTKPFDSGELLARIRARLRIKSGETTRINSNSISAYDISLDASTYKLSHGDKSVKLSNKEYQFMEYLMLNKGIILERDNIANRVWGFDDEGDYNNIAVYASFLRKKLRFIDAKAAIVTKKDVGYSLEENDGKGTA
ncbi:MAG: response regulator transcription factor [Lachnospiraceae bacterium]|nr:response regulator transcription factor [Lachnospiraceae bacterium]